MSQMAQQKLIQIWKGLLSYIAVAGLNEAKHDVSSFQVPHHTNTVLIRFYYYFFLPK